MSLESIHSHRVSHFRRGDRPGRAVCARRGFWANSFPLEHWKQALVEGLSATSEQAGHAEDGLFVTRVRAGGEDYVILSEPLPAPREPGGPLTAAERGVLVLLLEGRSNSAIAELRSTSLHTVANQVAAIYRKLDVGSRAELAARCYRPTESSSKGRA